MSCSEQETKKYCCASRSCFPASGSSFGYSTFEMVSDATFWSHRAVVIADVERVEVERLSGLGLPQPQQVRRRHAVPGIGVS